MIQIERTETWGFEHAIRGMRNPLNSWDRMDTAFYCYPDEENQHKFGENDLSLMRRLIAGGQPHRKFLRQIFVSADITAPLYWWKEFDTYKVGTTANSCSTMHKITAKPIELSDFSYDDFNIDGEGIDLEDCFINVVADCENLRNKYLATNDKRYWRGLIQLLPESYNQKRTVTMTYENLINMLEYRSNHKLSEWREFCEWICTLPCGNLLAEGAK